MIRCPKCGALNQDSSRFCNSCGAPLQRTQIRCPVCKTLNPAGNVFCDKCHTRLIPADAMLPRQTESQPSPEPGESVRQISLPVRSDLGKTGPLTGFPDWLEGLTDETPLPPTESEPAANDFQAEPVELPDWLLGILPQETASSGEEASQLPDWLGGLAAPESEVTPSAPAEEGPLPDWLSGIVTPSGAASAGTAAFIPEAPLPTGPAQAPPAEEAGGGAFAETPGAVPDWLLSLAPQDLPSEPTQGAFLIPEEETEEAEVPDLTPLPEPRKPTTDELARANVPEWLRSLRPEGSFGEATGVGDKGTVFVGAADLEATLGELEGELARAEIPEWLQELRPTGAPRPEGMTLEQFISQATETEGGPLSGMKGLLQPEAMVDIPPDYTPVVRYELPAAVLERARLWQTLLEQPRSAQRKMARRRVRPGMGEQLARWLVALVLLVVGIWPLLGYPVPVNVPLRNPSGLQGFVNTLEGLQPGARVLVAVEYGPAEAPEMAFMTEPLLTHLAARGAAVDWVSTLPEGVGLINNLRKDPAWDAGWQTPGYLPGATTGIASYVSLHQEYDVLIVLAARSDHLRWWIEQNTVGPRWPVLVGVSNAVGSLMIPYLEIENLKGVLIGVQDGTRYLAQRSGGSLAQYPMQRRQLNALVGLQWVTMVLLVGGMLWTLMTRKKGTG